MVRGPGRNWVSLRLKAGDCYTFASNQYHKGPANTTNFTRFILFGSFGDDDTEEAVHWEFPDGEDLD